MLIHCKETLGDGTVRYKDYEVEETTIDENAEISDYENALSEMGVRFDD